MSDPRPYGERLAVVETKLEALDTKLDEMKDEAKEAYLLFGTKLEALDKTLTEIKTSQATRGWLLNLLGKHSRLIASVLIILATGGGIPGLLRLVGITEAQQPPAAHAPSNRP